MKSGAKAPDFFCFTPFIFFHYFLHIDIEIIKH